MDLLDRIGETGSAHVRVRAERARIVVPHTGHQAARPLVAGVAQPKGPALLASSELATQPLLDQITQQNASAAEELSATAEELAGQAKTLRQRMEIFTLGAKRAAADDDAPALDEVPLIAPYRPSAAELSQFDYERF